MSIAFDPLCFILLFDIPTAVVLSHITCVLSCGYPSSSSSTLSTVPSFALINIPPSSDSAADYSTFLNTFANARIGPFISVVSLLLPKKLCPTHLLLPSGSPRHDASE